MMAHGFVEGLISYTGDESNVQASLDDMAAQMRQRALNATWQQRLAPDDNKPWWEAVLVDDEGNATTVAKGHVDPDAPDADAWGIVDGRLPHESPGDET